VDLDPRRSALVVVDLQYLYHRDHGAGARLRQLGTFETHAYMYDRIDSTVVPNVQRLLLTCRRKGVHIFYTRNATLFGDGADGSPAWARPGKEPGVNWCVAGSKESEILREVEPQPGEVLLSKTSSGAFATTALDAMLRHMGVTTMICCGVATNYCVESTVRAGADHGYEVVMVADACAARTADQERMAWEVLDGIYCRIVDTDEVLAGLDMALVALPELGAEYPALRR
jgi:nicotinamidase-related amidase